MNGSDCFTVWAMSSFRNVATCSSLRNDVLAVASELSS